MQEVDQSMCWYKQACADKMNEFYDSQIKNHDLRFHMSAFTRLLDRTDLKGVKLLDLGCGTAMLSDFCKDFTYVGADLPHIVSTCAMRNYPNYFYRSCDLYTDHLSWIKEFPVVVINGVIDILQYPLGVLAKILEHCSEYLIIHRQEITENGQTAAHPNGPGYAGLSYHSVISRKDFTSLIDLLHFDIIQEISLQFGNWENGGSSFLLRRRKSSALYEMDYKLYTKYFPGKENGFFIEAGANNGLAQSNTYYLEFYKNWKGILIEPLPEQYHHCVNNRSKQTHCVHTALTNDDNLRKIDMIYTPTSGGLMSVIDDPSGRRLMVRSPEKGIPMVVSATTLDAVLADYVNERIVDTRNADILPFCVDLLVLDVEGYELQALKGLSLSVWQIDYILVEELEQNEIIADYLRQFGYERIDQLSEHDYLYKKM